MTPGYRRIEIPKRSGGVRVIYAPTPERRRVLRSTLPVLRALDTSPHAHAFRLGRSPLTAALVHERAAAVISCDLRGFFDNVRPEQIAAGGVPEDVLDRILVDGAPRQGLPTSPAAANIAAIPLDATIAAALADRCPGATYTRYADDLTVGLPDRAMVEDARSILCDAVAAMGWEIHPGKWQRQDARTGRFVICGVVVGGGASPTATRRQRRRLRALRHRLRAGLEVSRGEGRGDPVERAHGLAEWCAMRPPIEGLLRERLGGRDPSPELVEALRLRARDRRVSLRATVEALDARALVRAARELDTRGAREPDRSRWALGLACTFGAAWGDWVRGAEARGCSLHDACYWLPVRGVPGDGLGARLMRWRREVPDLLSRGDDLSIVASEWWALSAAERAEPLAKILARARSRTYPGARDPALAAESARWGCSPTAYARIERRWSARRRIAIERIPRGELARAHGLVATVLDRDDPRVLWAGSHTACCQHPGGVAASSAWHAATDPRGAILAITVEDARDDRIVAQSWIWRRDNAIVLDNCETLGSARDGLADLYSRAAHALLGRLGISEVRIGADGDLAIPARWPLAAALRAPDGCYSDAREQRLIARSA